MTKPQMFLTRKSSESLSVRTLTTSDVAAFKNFLIQIGRETVYTMQYEGKPQRDHTAIAKSLADAADNPRALMLGAFRDEFLVAIVSLRPATDDHIWTNHIARFGLMVLKEFWGQGLATHLLKQAEDHAINAGFKRIEAEVRSQNDRGVGFYKHHGYKIEGTRRVAALINGEVHDEYFISKVFIEPFHSIIPASRIELGNGFVITSIAPSDRSAYLTHFEEREIYERTLNIPFPYTDNDADFWFNFVDERTKLNGRPVQFAIRNTDGNLIGGIGFDDLIIGKTHKAELGYWLAKSYWSKGIMTKAVNKVCELGFAEFALIRITANIFAFNTGSQRVLEKNGFIQEGILKKHYLKDGKFLDGKLFALVKE